MHFGGRDAVVEVNWTQECIKVYQQEVICMFACCFSELGLRAFY